MPNLLLCMTPGVGLNTWEQIGTLQRELRPYKEYRRRGWNIKILTFDKARIPALPDGVEAVRFPDRKLLWLLPWTHNKLGAWADLIKTNQSVHAYFYTSAAKRWNKPILLRCGYVHGEFLETTRKFSPKTNLYKLMEQKAFHSSTHCEIPTEELFNWVSSKYGIANKKLSIVPNFVDVDVFKPISSVKKNERSVVSVGRLTPVKRFDLLIKACAGIPGCKLTIIGEGPEKTNLHQLAQDCNVQLSLPGNVSNDSLPQILQQHTIFAIVSSWEGHPKALVEAMACGMPCVGTEETGIQNVINHNKDGLLVKSSITSVGDGLNRLFQSKELRTDLSREARKKVEIHFSFDACFSHEYRIVQHMLA